MKFFIPIFCLLLMTLSFQQTCTGNPILYAKKALDIAIKVYKGLQSAEGILEDAESKAESGARMRRELSGISQDIQEMKDRLISKLTNDFRDKLTEKTDELFAQVDVINKIYEDFMKMYRNRDKLDQGYVRQFINEILSPTNSRVKNKAGKMYRALLQKDIRGDNIINILLRNSSAQNTMCLRGESAQIMIHDLYELAVTTDTKVLLMLLYSWDIKKVLDKKPENHFELEKNMTIEYYNNTVENTFDSVFKAMAKASTQVWKCDPGSYQKGVTFFKFNGVLQTYFLYQTDVVGSPWPAFWTKCEDYKDKRLYCQSFPCKTQPESRRCTGHIRDCQFISRWMQLCHSPMGSDRRYDWMLTEEEEVYGSKNGDCSWYTQGVGSALTIDTCSCTCDSEDQLVERYFSLQEELSDVQDNKVVTGIRFVKKNKVLHLQIQQGTMGPRGNITDKPDWKDVREITDNQLLSENVSVSYNNENGKWVEFKTNNLVYTITYGKNTVLLDDVHVNPGNVVTGLRFRDYENDLYLLVHQTPFNYTTGKLNTSESEWKRWTWSGISKKQRQEVVLESPNDPAKVTQSEDYSHHGKFVHLRMSDVKRDLGQNVVPFIDMQEITLDPPSPLEGLGIFHRGRKYFGGFISPKIIHYNFTRH